ncbi:MBL fold metallo-hydrolase [Flavihumibacter petaseus]|uniref:Putative hydrolase n=1 Tax=Flavihumibacter petaseus NBRC 106054 TaxID=1220578 RepID=A0A0E9N5P6_9BACT|nr:MBL fold metallo-hydrolase [Flavihumibacter petaseus]GAO45287.1 putative hydrolase [Flavihumibacter petaseus NBRC 106054]
MFIQQLYTSCLSESAYYIESNGEAAIIDPLRDIKEYTHLAKSRNAVIKYIFETHFHADFISGHLDLSKVTGAPIVFGPNTKTNYPIHLAKDGEVFQLGAITLEVLHTPGHTIESTCYLLKDDQGEPQAIFTGDTLFVGDVGRPDLSSGNLAKEELAGLLFDSLQQKIVTLPDQVVVYPAHGPGSSCGKQLGPETYSTIGTQRQQNYALQATDKASFIKAVTEGLDEPPAYFSLNARINKEGYGTMEDVMRKGMRPITAPQLRANLEKEQLVLLDTRPAIEFVDGFVPGSVSIGLEGRYAEWAGSLLSFDTPVVLITSDGKAEESLVRLARVGFENIIGYLSGGYAAWEQEGFPTDMIISVDADELAMDLPHDPNLVVVDVRKPAEFADGHVAGAINLNLSDLNDPATMANLEEQHNLYLHCAGGYRSVIAASLFKRQGIHNLRNVNGGWKSISALGSVPVEKETSMLN